MRVTEYMAAAALIAGFSITGHAADQNGYTAQFECRAGNPNCNVDVNSYVSRTCQQTITPADSNSTISSKINGGSQIVCVEPGDYTGKGTITITASGSSNAYKVLRYTRGGDNSDAPWNQSWSSRARFHQLIVRGAHYWIVHRLSFPAADVEDRIDLHNSPSNIIFNRMLLEGRGQNYFLAPYSVIDTECYTGSNSTMITLQNSVIRDNGGIAGTDPTGVAFECGSNFRVVNNEIYDWSSHNIQIGHNGGPMIPGVVIENNNVYHTPGFAGQGEDPIAIKAYGSASNPIRIIHNRIWGGRMGDSGSCCIGGGGGGAIVINNGRPFEYILIQNNLIFDNRGGINWYGAGNLNTNQSIIGNIFYKLGRYGGPYSSAIEIYDAEKLEIYLNTIIESEERTIDYGGSDTDVRCNVLIASGRREGGNPSSSFRADNNAFYGTPVINLNGSGSYINKSLSTRQSHTNYAAGTVVRWEDSWQCSTGSEAGCFLYIARQTGTSDGSANACTTLGCTFSDGSVTWQAIRGPYTFWRKQHTGQEQMAIPYARVHATAPEAYACPSDFAARPGIGINDER
jgi:hypothetical protein